MGLIVAVEKQSAGDKGRRFHEEKSDNRQNLYMRENVIVGTNADAFPAL